MIKKKKWKRKSERKLESTLRVDAKKKII